MWQQEFKDIYWYAQLGNWMKKIKLSFNSSKKIADLNVSNSIAISLN